MGFRVEVSEEAHSDLVDIIDWLALHYAGNAGLEWFEGLEQAIASLATMPKRCPVAPEDSELPVEVRHLVYGRKPDVYRIIFTVQNEVVYVMHVWHGRRAPAIPS